MKKYYEVVGERLTLELEMTKLMTVEEVQKELKLSSKLREVDKKEFNKLTAEFTGRG